MKFFTPLSPIGNNMKGLDVVFFCKDCDKIVDVIPVGRKFVYKCAICKTKNVAFGTDKAIRNYYRIPEEKVEEGAVGAVKIGESVEKSEEIN
jgi:hypothetical protein